MSSLSSLICVQDFEDEACRVLPKAILEYYKSGAVKEQTLRENRDAFQRWYILPHFLIDVSRCDLSTTVLGHKVRLPFGAAPSAMQKMAHPEGERGIAKAAANNGTIYTLSTISTTSIEDVALEGNLRFFQLYIYKDREITAQLVHRAEKAGFKALVLTVDAPKFGIRYADIRNKFQLPSHLRLANFDLNDQKSSTAGIATEGSGIGIYVNSLFDPSLNWNDVTWLQSITRLPIVLKGILTPEDAVKGISFGAAAIWVSNHGARQLDGVLPSIDALPDIVRAVGDKCEIYVDGGFRTGTDVFKALALGAKMVFLGRPLLWGLACGGYAGANKIFTIMKDELENAMKLSGCPSISSIKSHLVVQRMRSNL